MALDLSSYPAYITSLGIKKPVAARPGRMIPGPPAALLEIALRLGLGPFLFDTPRTRAIVENVGLNPDIVRVAGRQLRTRDMWLPVMEHLAEPNIADAEQLAAHGDRQRAIEKIRAALLILFVGLCGDGYYFYTPMARRPRMMRHMRHLHALLRRLSGARTQRLAIPYPGGKTVGLLRLPARDKVDRRHPLPALLAFHPLGSDKDNYDWFLDHFREAGYATFCIDLPAHGENFFGPRLRPDAEYVGAAALEVLARQPGIDPQRLGVMGGSLGAYFAHRTAALAARASACLAYASPFDLSDKAEDQVPGVIECFSWIVGARQPEDSLAIAREFNLREAAPKERCPVCIVHGTQDHLCDFSASYEIASRVKTPVTVVPLEGVDHEASYPSTAELARPGIEWLNQTL
jgi:alpha-beta hydrolase superfamily lysophospholipase